MADYSTSTSTSRWAGAAAIQRTNRKQKNPGHKVFLCVERTYMHWVRFAGWFTAFAIGLIHLHGTNVVEKATIVVTFMDFAALYAVVQFLRRGNYLQNMFDPEDDILPVFYDKIWAPVTGLLMMLFFTLYVAMLWVIGPEWHMNVLTPATTSA